MTDAGALDRAVRECRYHWPNCYVSEQVGHCPHCEVALRLIRRRYMEIMNARQDA